MDATLTLDTHFHVGPIDPRLFGGFIEHLGRGIYGGLYEPGGALSDAQGFRTDVLAALREMGMPLVRYPGGNFVSNYDWRDGVGPLDRRPARPDYAWQTVEPNTFGTDEFAAWCRAMGTEPMMVVNLGTHGAAEAGAWVEYCNLPGGTYWSDRRIAHGARAPHAIRHWALGNEMDGPWQAGHVPAEEYALRADQAGKLMKGLDPSILLTAAGSTARFMSTYMAWDRAVLEYCWADIDFISAHRYSHKTTESSAWFLAEGIEVDRALEDYRAAIGYVRALKKSDKRVYVAFDEWNVWSQKAPSKGGWRVAPPLLEEVYTLEDAIVCAQYLASFIRHADLVKIACLAQIVNVIAPILTRPTGLVRQTIYYPFVLFSRHMRGRSLTPVLDGPTYAAGKRGETPALDAAAAYDAEAETACVALINRDASRDLEVRVRWNDQRIASVRGAEVLTGKDLLAANTWESPQVVVPAAASVRVERGEARVSVPGPGVVVARFDLRPG